jgi:3-hydroxybutyryl-CoA dehydrogenase
MTQPVPPLDATARIGVLGAGAMGRGIAQVAALHGHDVVLGDMRPDAVAEARDGIARALARLVEKKRMTADEAAAVQARVSCHATPTGDASMFRGCALVIEAIVESLDAKQRAFKSVEREVEPDAVLATNTSSLAVTAIAASCARPERVIGVHFFNPAPVMPLVEVVPGLATASTVTGAVHDLVTSWRKVPVIASDTPGFIVNRVARPFYGEALRVLDEGVADIATIDWAMREIGGFRMGPFELMDFIGHDVNFVVTRSVFEALFNDPRYRPSVPQQRLVEAGWLGRKSGRGFYDYRTGAVTPEPVRDRALGQGIVTRVVAMLINEAVDAVQQRVATAADVELAMTRGVNYPHGLLSWGEALGYDRVLATIESLQAEFGEDRYRPSPLLRRMAREPGSRLA